VSGLFFIDLIREMARAVRITSNLNKKNIDCFIKQRLNPMINSFFDDNEGENKNHERHLHKQR